jgi:hypothetical protein
MIVTGLGWIVAVSSTGLTRGLVGTQASRDLRCERTDGPLGCARSATLDIERAQVGVIRP